MNTTITIVVIIVIVGVVLIASVASEITRRRSARLQQRFGPEYDDTMKSTGGRAHAEAELRNRQARHHSMRLRTLPPETRRHYHEEWNGIQRRFGDVPRQAVRDADHLIQAIMRDIGYPVDSFEQGAADLSVEHPDLVRHYRSAHSVAEAQRHGHNTATEPLGQAATHYRILVDELLEGEEGEPGPRR
jgi:hypothetical protein